MFDGEKHGRAVCLVMELLRGGTLAEVLRRRGPLRRGLGGRHLGTADLINRSGG